MNTPKKLKPIPQFQTEKEEADFWAVHDTTEYNFENTNEQITLSPSLKAKLGARRRERLRKVLELDEEKFKQAQMIAERKKIDQSSLFKQWIEEGIERETSQNN